MAFTEEAPSTTAKNRIIGKWSCQQIKGNYCSSQNVNKRLEISFSKLF